MIFKQIIPCKSLKVNTKSKIDSLCLSILDLRPIENKLLVDDMQKISSAYTKDMKPVDFIKNSLVVYADKKRTTKLLRTIGFKTPIALQQSGYIGNISYHGPVVKINGDTFSNVFKENVSDDENMQNDDRDSDGKALTKEQIEFFKNSKVRDANGNLLRVYHGSASKFTVFLYVDEREKKHVSILFEMFDWSQHFDNIDSVNQKNRNEKVVKTLCVWKLDCNTDLYGFGCFCENSDSGTDCEVWRRNRRQGGRNPCFGRGK